MVDKLCAVPYEAVRGMTSYTNQKVSEAGIWRVLATGKQNPRFDMFQGRNVKRCHA
jgi:hypothetical protein